MRLAILACLIAAPLFARTMPSGLQDPLENATTCFAFYAKIKREEGNPILWSIAFDEAAAIHRDFRPSIMEAARSFNVYHDYTFLIAEKVQAVCYDLFIDN